MAGNRSSDHRTLEGAPVFTTTHWSLVLAAKGDESLPAEQALATLCESYWYPLYVFVRKRGNGPHDAQDLTQAFFEKLLEKNYLGDVVPEKGKFRTFLLAALKHFLANDWHRSQAAKRGGGQTIVSLDDTDAEARFRLEPADGMTAETLFERRWAMTLLDQVMGRLREEMESSDKGEIFSALKDHLLAGDAALPFAEAGEKLGISEGAARVAAHRLRKRYREILRDEISQTVADPAEVDDEIRHLVSVLALGNEK